MRYILSALFAMALSACGTVSSVKLAIQVPEKTSFVFRDERPPEQKLSRTDNSSSGAVVIFGDNNIVPPVTEMMRAKLQERLSTQLEGKTVSLSEFQISVIDPAVSVDMNGLHTAAASTPGGYAAAPLAGVFILGIEKIKSEKIVLIRIKGALDNMAFFSYVSDNYRGRVTEENIRTSLERVLEDVTTEIQKIALGK